ncbi:DnaD domain protein [Psychrobacillus sp. FSL K6-2365]|uniref:DnaD domain-containing protein n=1 Tax=Psychrobacillus sp. FSL K6-2365 TaxID=2921546 RepID=UPI0030F82D6F
MSKYRSVQVSFWQDAFVLDLTPEEKYFYVYLMTNSKANQIGIYELPKRIIETETGYNRETVEKLLNRFMDYEKIIYNEPTKEVMLLNWSKHNWNNSPKVVKRVEDELKGVKFLPFIDRYRESIENTDFNKVSIQYPYNNNAVPIEYVDSMDIREKRKEKREKEKEKENDNEKEHGKNSEEVIIKISPFQFYEENGFGIITPYVGDKVNAWIDDLSEELIIHAMKIAIENSVLKWNYVESILKDWFIKKIKSVDDVIAMDLQRKQQQPTNFGKSFREEKVPEWFGKKEEPVSTPVDEDPGITVERERLQRELMGG